ncbi:hypothetical protein Z946_4032 [Sulfitobacter noctilucicola]|nr:hypothetical protein Z946_4032 [Sulfitobacter noctilucicola]
MLPDAGLSDLPSFIGGFSRLVMGFARLRGKVPCDEFLLNPVTALRLL